jgi:hypothetical protein
LIVPLFTTCPLAAAPNRQDALSAKAKTAIPRKFISAPSAALIAACLNQVSFGPEGLK